LQAKPPELSKAQYASQKFLERSQRNKINNTQDRSHEGNNTDRLEKLKPKEKLLGPKLTGNLA
jgi:hypothetical protein